MYVCNNVIVTPIDAENVFNQYCKFEVKLKDQSKCRRPLTITLIYRSPNSTMDNTKELAKLMEKCKKNCLIIGDFNLPKTDFDGGTSDASGRPVLEAASIRFLSNLVNFPSHIRGNMLDIALADFETKGMCRRNRKFSKFGPLHYQN